MYSKTFCSVIQGIEGRIIEIEADISDGLPGFSLVGYLSSEVKEARERVRIALKNTGFRFPPKRVTVNLSPADIRKDGTGYDLAIAISILVAYGCILEEHIQSVLFLGELTLEGEVRPVQGVLPMVYTAKEHGLQYCILPQENVAEAQLVDGIGVIGVASLRQVVELLGKPPAAAESPNVQEISTAVQKNETLDFCNVRGQAAVRRAVEVAVTGMHNFMMIGPPGSGKSMIAKCIPGIMPSLSFEEKMEISKIYSVAGLLSQEQPMITNRPFRAPHHTITQTALAGGGRYPTPGEISLASGGVLFLDELPEFDRNTLEVLRQPLEDGWVNVARVGYSCRYPARVLLLTALNPCPCGWFPDRRRCSCTPGQVRKYLGRISQPLLDRMDICTETIPLRYRELETLSDASCESSEQIRQRVEQAQQIQRKRYEKESFFHNAQLTPEAITRYCPMTAEARGYLEQIFEQMEFSARAYHKIVRVGRSIADLAQSEQIQREHIAEAVFYRSIDQKYWGGEEAGRNG